MRNETAKGNPTILSIPLSSRSTRQHGVDTVVPTLRFTTVRFSDPLESDPIRGCYKQQSPHQASTKNICTTHQPSSYTAMSFPHSQNAVQQISSRFRRPRRDHEPKFLPATNIGVEKGTRSGVYEGKSGEEWDRTVRPLESLSWAKSNRA